jgi:hypothetical protein
MSWIMAAWRAFPAAPETRHLRALRLHSLSSLVATAVLVAIVHLLWLVHPFLVLAVPLVGVHALVVTGRYWVLKQRADARHHAGTPEEAEL